MSFLRLIALFALPLASLPIVIHLLHRRRHPAVTWAATMFLRRATASRRRPARLRRYLILASRVLIVVAMVFALARPLSSTQFGFGVGEVSGRQATTVVILDRSPSMQRRLGNAKPTRLELGRRRIASALETLGVETFTLLESVGKKPIDMSEPSRLLDAAITSPAGSTADIPAMLLDALVMLEAAGNQVADIWLCTDRQLGDWNLSAPQWESIRGRLDRETAIRVHLLEFGEASVGNKAVRVTDVRSAGESGEQIAIDVMIESDDTASASVPLRISLGDTTTVEQVSVRDGVGTLVDLRLPMTVALDELCGQVSIPSDVNVSDDQWFFVGPSDAARRSLLVAEEECAAVRVALDLLGEVDSTQAETMTRESLDSIACVVWQGALPKGDPASLIREFVDSGGTFVCFPSWETDAMGSFDGVSFDLVSEEDGSASYAGYEFPFKRAARVSGIVTKLAEAASIGTVIGSQRIGSGEVLYCGVDVTRLQGAFIDDGVVLYGLLSDAINNGSRRRLGAGSFSAGEELPEALASMAATARPVFSDAAKGVSAFEFGSHAGVFSLGGKAEAKGRLVAINRPVDEFSRLSVTDEELKAAFGNFEVNRVALAETGRATEAGVVREVWGVVWLLVIGLLIAESWLSLPPVRGPSP